MSGSLPLLSRASKMFFSSWVGQSIDNLSPSAAGRSLFFFHKQQRVHARREVDRDVPSEHAISLTRHPRQLKQNSRGRAKLYRDFDRFVQLRHSNTPTLEAHPRRLQRRQKTAGCCQYWDRHESARGGMRLSRSTSSEIARSSGYRSKHSAGGGFKVCYLAREIHIFRSSSLPASGPSNSSPVMVSAAKNETVC